MVQQAALFENSLPPDQKSTMAGRPIESEHDAAQYLKAVGVIAHQHPRGAAQ
jgi:hypothetical protein